MTTIDQKPDNNGMIMIIAILLVGFFLLILCAKLFAKL